MVVANKDLGMTVSGRGLGDPGRSVNVLESQIVTFLPELRDVYEHERIQDPSLMGSLDVNMTIEPNGTVSDLRFPVRRVSNDRVTIASFNLMRAWSFTPAELPVQLRFTLLFVPPGVDEASILLWEKRLGNRPVIEKVDESQAPKVVAAATPVEKKAQDEFSKKRSEESGLQTANRSPTAVKAPTSEMTSPSAKGKNTPSELTGWYRVLYPTALRTGPQESTDVITRLRKGTRVRVVNVIQGKWLEVRSVSDRPSGFLWWEDAVPEHEERVEQK
jgi:hypothetical protein